MYWLADQPQRLGKEVKKKKVRGTEDWDKDGRGVICYLNRIKAVTRRRHQTYGLMLWSQTVIRPRPKPEGERSALCLQTSGRDLTHVSLWGPTVWVEHTHTSNKRCGLIQWSNYQNLRRLMQLDPSCRHSATQSRGRGSTLVGSRNKEILTRPIYTGI